MSRVYASSIPAFPAAIVATVFGLGMTLAIASASPAKAYDDDVDVVCFDTFGGSQTECQTVDQLTAECEKADPEFTTDECQGLLQNRRPFGLTTPTVDRGKDKYRRDDNGGKGPRDPHGGRDPNGSGNSGGSNSGGANGSGPNGGGNDSAPTG